MRIRPCARGPWSLRIVLPMASHVHTSRPAAIIYGTRAHTTRFAQWPRLWSRSSTERRWWPPRRPGTAYRWTRQLLRTATSRPLELLQSSPPRPPLSRARTLCVAALAGRAAVRARRPRAERVVRTQRKLPTANRPTAAAADPIATGSDVSTLSYI